MRKITQWINTKFSVSLKDQDYNAITEFLLLWNLFENKLFENNFTIEKAKNSINLDDHKIDDFFNIKIL